MGSVGEHEKGATPFLDRIVEHNRRYANMIDRCAADVPLWRRIAAKCGWSAPAYRWQMKNQHRYEIV
jgi:hypothetical protein